MFPRNKAVAHMAIPGEKNVVRPTVQLQRIPCPSRDGVAGNVMEPQVVLRDDHAFAGLQDVESWTNSVADGGVDGDERRRIFA